MSKWFPFFSLFSQGWSCLDPEYRSDQCYRYEGSDVHEEAHDGCRLGPVAMSMSEKPVRAEGGITKTRTTVSLSHEKRGWPRAEPLRPWPRTWGV
jgi:hypothetical protein